MSEAKDKGISLRRKKTTRPTISAPRQLSQTSHSQQRDHSADSRQNSLWETQTQNSTGTGRGGESRGGDKTSDLVKRRYSTRFAGGVPQYGDGGSFAPPMPSMPAQYAGAGGREGSVDGRSQSRDERSPERRQGGMAVDRRALGDPNLAPEQYVQNILADATESDIYAYQAALQDVKAESSTNLQHNVYQNRTQFIKISKEADKLKSEMRTLRIMMSELTGALGHATSAGGAGVDTNGSNGELSVADRKRANRSSVANLEAMWSTHLQVLWKRVEGSQKYLPALPGRHIIMESQRWVELNAATWKPRRRVALVLLNDHLLLASEKKRNDLINSGQNDAKNKRQSMYNPSAAQSQTTMMVAERCWGLQDVTLVDISTGGKPASRQEQSIMSNAINLRAGNESFTFATSDTTEKAGLLVAFRKAQEDLRKQVAAEHGAREKQVDETASLTGSRDARLLKKPVGPDGLEETSTGLSRNSSIMLDVDGRQQSIRWVESQIDTLDIDIALTRFTDAVDKVEKLRKLASNIRSNATASDIIMAKVNARAAKLASNITRQLTQTSSSAEKTKENTAWLVRLGYSETAQSAYLTSRTETLRLRTRQLPFTGSLPPYLHALAYVTFTLLLHSIRTFSSSFPPASSSAVIKWAKERVDEFNDLLARQLSSVDVGSALWEECINVVKEHAGVLQEVGVDFTGLVARNLSGDVDERRAAERIRGGLSSGVGDGNDGVGLGVTT